LARILLEAQKKQVIVLDKPPPANLFWYARQDSNLRPTDSKCRNLEIQKCRDFNQLILFNFFNQLLVSFGNVWKYLTLTGTIWAQSYLIMTPTSLLQNLISTSINETCMLGHPPPYLHNSVICSKLVDVDDIDDEIVLKGEVLDSDIQTDCKVCC